MNGGEWPDAAALTRRGPFAPAFTNAILVVLARRYPGLQISVDELVEAAGMSVESVYDLDKHAWQFTPVKASKDATPG